MDGDNRVRNMFGSHMASIDKYTPRDEYMGVMEYLKRKSSFNDISKIWKYEICI